MDTYNFRSYYKYNNIYVHNSNLVQRLNFGKIKMFINKPLEKVDMDEIFFKDLSYAGNKEIRRLMNKAINKHSPKLKLSAIVEKFKDKIIAIDIVRHRAMHRDKKEKNEFNKR